MIPQLILDWVTQSMVSVSINIFICSVLLRSLTFRQGILFFIFLPCVVFTHGVKGDNLCFFQWRLDVGIRGAVICIFSELPIEIGEAAVCSVLSGEGTALGELPLPPVSDSMSLSDRLTSARTLLDLIGSVAFVSAAASSSP